MISELKFIDGSKLSESIKSSPENAYEIVKEEEKSNSNNKIATLGITRIHLLA
tara:strand:- start:825 stop:983 length:159 start_codon:yes stop_codon:yes gene_type:complete